MEEFKQKYGIMGASLILQEAARRLVSRGEDEKFCKMLQEIADDLLVGLEPAFSPNEIFQKAIADALGTDERGENLISVARDAHRAEQELSARK